VFGISRIFPKAARASDGFVLIELVVAMIAAVALGAVIVLMMQVSMGEAARVSGGVNAARRGRLALETIIGEMHNSCIAARVAPVGAGSGANRLLIISGSSSGAGATETVSLHEITLVRGTLRDTSYASAGTRPGSELEFARSGTTRTLATGLSAVGRTPVFQYFAYGSGAEPQSMSLPSPLSSAAALEVSAVTVTFTAAPQSAGGSLGRAFVISETAVLRQPSTTPGESASCA
jgi:hypothetical protein